MPKLVMEIRGESESLTLRIYIENENIVFDMRPDSYEDDPAGGGLVQAPLGTFQNMLQHLVASVSPE